MIGLTSKSQKCTSSHSAKRCNSQIIAPGLWCGYRLPSAKRHLKPTYYPAINQVWISGSFSQRKIYSIISHELIHAFSASLQPPRLLPLNSVLNQRGIPWTDHFEDIIETIAELCYSAHLSLPKVDKIRRYGERTRYPLIYEELVGIWMTTVDKASPELPKKVALEEALRGLCVLSMHIIPHRPQTGFAIFRAMKDISPPDNWLKSQDIWFTYYRELDKKINKTKILKKQFTLAMPVGEHRFIADTVFFIATVIERVLLEPDIVTAVFPTLLELLTQESFILLPVLLVEETHGKSRVHIKIIHTTYRSRRTPDRAAFAREKEAAEMAKEGRYCCVTPIFVTIIRRSRQFRLSNNKDRSYKCFQAMLELLPNLLKEKKFTKSRCSGCILLGRDEQFQSACDTIINMSLKAKRALVKAAKDYERFLLIDTACAIQEEWELPEAPRPVCHYSFL